MVRNKDRWSALSMGDRAALIDIYVKSGITDLGEIRRNYNGIPYKDFNTSNYDYFNASPEMTPTKEGQHWDSRNPHTGRLLKREDHPTFDLLLEGEKQAGYKIIRGYNGELYSVPDEPTNYVEDYNNFGGGGPIGAGQATYNHPRYNHKEEAAMYSYLRSRGVPHTQASVIMGNIAVESMLNPEITQIGGGGGYGLIQATDRSRKKAFINYDGQPYEFGSDISPETQRQLDYIVDKGLDKYTVGEWRGNENIARARKARERFLKETNIDKASKIFTENYLRPGKPHEKRRRSMSRYFNDTYATTESALKEFENAFLFNDKNAYDGGGIIESYINPSSIEGALGKGVVQLLDPTGISSYPDVYDAGKKFFNDPSWRNFGRLTFETVGALPLVGKVTAPFKAAKVAKIASKIDDLHTLGKIADSATNVNKAIDTLPELIPLTRKAAERTQDITTKYIVDPLFDMWASKNKYDRVRDFKIANALVPIINGANNTADIASTAENVVEIAK